MLRADTNWSLKLDKPGVSRAAVKWDRPPQTFFAQVFVTPAKDDGEEKATIWQGTSLRELPTAAGALTIVLPYATVPDDLLARLKQDRVQSMSRTNGPLQLGMKQVIYRPTRDARLEIVAALVPGSVQRRSITPCWEHIARYVII